MATHERELIALTADIAEASLHRVGPWLRLYGADENGEDVGEWVEHDRERTRDEYRLHLQECLADALRRDDFRLLPPYLLEPTPSGAGIRLNKGSARGFRRRLRALGLTLPANGRPAGRNGLALLMLEVLTEDPDASCGDVAGRLQRWFPEIIRSEPGVRVRWARSIAEADLGLWEEQRWGSFKVKLSRLRRDARAENENWR